MPQLTLTEVLPGEPREWSPKDKPNVKNYSYRVKDDKGTVYEISTKGDPPKLGPDDFKVTPPKEGTNFPPKLSRNFQGGGGRKSPEQAAYWDAKDQRDIRREQRDIEAIPRITRSHAQEMAVRVLTANGANDTIAELAPAKARELIKEWTDWFQQDATGPGLGGSEGGNPAPASPTAESSATTSVPRAASADAGPPASASGPSHAEGQREVRDSAAASPPAAVPGEIAKPNRKGQTTRRLRDIGVGDPDIARIAHHFAGKPPTVEGLDAIDAAIQNLDYTALFDETGVERPAQLPDSRDLAPVVHDESTVL